MDTKETDKKLKWFLMHIIKMCFTPMMQTTDILMKVDPSYGPITKHFHENPKEFHDALQELGLNYS